MCTAEYCWNEREGKVTRVPTCDGLVSEGESVQVAAGREAHDIGAARVEHLLAVNRGLPLQHRIPKRDTVRRQQIIQRWHIRATCVMQHSVSRKDRTTRVLSLTEVI